MLKVLILCYDFPPYNSIGAQRPQAWYKYLKDFNIYPIIITRHWDRPIKNSIDYVKPSETTQVEYETTDHGTIIRTPFYPNLRDRFLIKYGFSKFSFIRKFLSFFYSILQYYSKFFDNKRQIFYEAQNFLAHNKVDCILATGEPYVLFKYAKKLSKKYNVPWIADYRDAWFSNMNQQNNILQKISNYLIYYLEKQIVKTASHIIVAPPNIENEIQKMFPQHKVDVVLNGYFEEYFENIDLTQNKEFFKIAYSGTLYTFQPLELFIEGFKIFLSKINKTNVKLFFYGNRFFPEQHARVLNATKDIANFVVATERLPQEVFLRSIQDASLLLLLSSPSVKNTFAKVFDYLPLRKKILMVPDDYGFLSRIIDECNAGVKCNTPQEIAEELYASYVEWMEKGYVTSQTSNYQQYSRKEQTKKLAGIIVNLIGNKSTN